MTEEQLSTAGEDRKDRALTPTAVAGWSWKTNLLGLISAACSIILVLLAIFGGPRYIESFFEPIFERINALTDQIHISEKEIRGDLGEKLEKQTDAIQKNTQGLAVLQERLGGVEEKVEDLKEEFKEDVDRLEGKIDNLPRSVTKTGRRQ